MATVNELEKRLDALESRVKAVETSAASRGTSTADADLSARVAALETRDERPMTNAGTPATHEVMRAMTLESGPVMPGDVITLDDPTHVRTLEGSGYVRPLGADRLTYAERAALRPTNNVAVRQVSQIVAAANAALAAAHDDASQSNLPGVSRTAAENLALAGAGADDEADALKAINAARKDAGLEPVTSLADAGLGGNQPAPGTTEQLVAGALGEHSDASTRTDGDA